MTEEPIEGDNTEPADAQPVVGEGGYVIPPEELAPTGGSNPKAHERFAGQATDREALLAALGGKITDPDNVVRRPPVLYRHDIQPQEWRLFQEYYKRLVVLMAAELPLSEREVALYLLLEQLVGPGQAVVSSIRSGFLPPYRYSDAAKSAFDWAVGFIQFARVPDREALEERLNQLEQSLTDQSGD